MQQDLNILQVNNLSKHFGGLAAVSNCSLKIEKGSITGIIGPNGSGKTTLFNLIAGNLKPSNGNVMFHGEDITGIPSLCKFTIKSHNSQFYKTYITQKMLEKGYLAANGVYMSTCHNIIILKKYEEILDEIFYEISLCERGIFNIDYLLNYPVSKVPFGRVN